MEKSEHSLSSNPASEVQVADNTELEEPSTSHKTNEDVDTTSSMPRPSHSLTFEQNPLSGWTKHDKFQLYLGIKFKGSKNIEDIQESIPDKTLEEIKAAISHYKERANKTPECTTKKLNMKKRKPKSLIPLASWAKLLTDNLSFNELQTEMVSALRLIADLDNIPPASCTDQIDLRQAYHQIADAMEGKSLTNIRFITEVLNSCIFETALVSKSFILPSVFKSILSAVDLKDTTPAFPQYTRNCEKSIIHHLACQKNYNPLGIPSDYLTPSTSTYAQSSAVIHQQ